MLRPVAEGGQQKNQSALDAATHFIRLLNLSPGGTGSRDRVAVIGFNETAWTELALTSGRTSVEAAIVRIGTRTAEGTRLDLAFRQARSEIQSAREPSRTRRVAIILTDGLPNHVPFPPGSSQEEVVMGAAALLKADGVKVYSIGLGLPADIDAVLLRGVASSPEQYFEVPDPATLIEIYAAIAARIDECP